MKISMIQRLLIFTTLLSTSAVQAMMHDEVANFSTEIPYAERVKAVGDAFLKKHKLDKMDAKVAVHKFNPLKIKNQAWQFFVTCLMRKVWRDKGKDIGDIFPFKNYLYDVFPYKEGEDKRPETLARRIGLTYQKEVLDRLTKPDHLAHMYFLLLCCPNTFNALFEPRTTLEDKSKKLVEEKIQEIKEMIASEEEKEKNS